MWGSCFEFMVLTDVSDTMGDSHFILYHGDVTHNFRLNVYHRV